MALEGQAGGITVSTLREAEYYFAHGIIDIVYAVGIAPVKLSRVIRLIEKGAKIILLLDSTEQVAFVAKKAQKHNIEIPVLIEIDCDGHRSGVTPDDPLLLKISGLIERTEGVNLQGILTHAGESYFCKSVDEIRNCAHHERNAAVKCANILRQNGLPCVTVSIGSTPTVIFAEDLTGITEVRAGVFMFYDLVMAGLGVCDKQAIAISVLASVIDHQKEKRWTICDAGWMALSKDKGTARQKIDQSYGVVCDIAGRPIPDILVSGLSQEHGIITNRERANGQPQSLPLGEMVRVLPNHACATSASFDRYYVVNGGEEVIDVWHRINGWEEYPTSSNLTL